MKNPQAGNRPDKAMRAAWMLVQANHRRPHVNRPLVQHNQIGV